MQNHVTSQTIVVVDDEPGILESLRKIFEREAYQVLVTDSGDEALAWLRDQHIDLVLADVMMPKMHGIDLLRAIKKIAPATEVVMMTAFGTIDNAVQCMREGAYDFISKPLKRAIVVRSVQRALEHRNLIHENRQLRQLMTLSQTKDMVGTSIAMRRMFDVVAQAAPSAATILLVGDSGTGKELLAHTIHRLSDRQAAPFVAVNCAALPENLLETELFGHEKGAFTGATGRREGRFERAHGGTIFLDEIGETSAAVQLRLLRVLQESEIERVGGEDVVHIDVRVVAATHRNLEEDIKAKRFREDLYYRLNVIKIQVPPLRDRGGDIFLLAQHFMHFFCEKNNKHLLKFSDAAITALEHYHFPGNVRELENMIERAVVLCRGDMINLEDLPDNVITQDHIYTSQKTSEGFFVPFDTPLKAINRLVISQTLKRTDGDKNLAGKILGIAPRTIDRKKINLLS